MFYSVFHNFRAFECVDAYFIFSKKNDVTLTRHDVITLSQRKSRLARIPCRKHIREKSQEEFWLLVELPE